MESDPTASTEQAEDLAEEAPDDDQPDEARREFVTSSAVRNSISVMLSMVVHLALLVALGLWMLPSRELNLFASLIVDVAPEADEEMALETVTTFEAVSQPSNAAFAGEISGGGGGTGGGIAGSGPVLDRTVQEQAEGIGIGLEGPPIEVPGSQALIGAVPRGALGEPRAIVDNMDEALDRITKEILLMLAESPVLVIWLFDQSESMKDDQREIRDKIDRVYTELGLKEAAAGEALHTAVCSFGRGFVIHTPQPTSDLWTIRQAIDNIPNDPTGLENTCPAIIEAIGQHLPVARRGRRQLAMILVSDESGEHETNNVFLENAVTIAKEANCRIYTLGREAVFGYPYVHIRWIHPQTGHEHWLPVNRGPETGFVEQLQTEGFRKRYDAHNSGFGPYEHARLAQQTGGVFFMLPSLESNLVRGEKRRYDLQLMRAYLPDLRSRQVLLDETQQSELRSVLVKIINDLNPYRKQIADAMEVRFEFSADPNTFLQQVAAEQQKAQQYILYLDAAAKALEKLRPRRLAEYHPRWQANYDLIFAQVLAYTARTYEYGAYLEKFKQQPKVVPFEKPGMIRLSQWHLRETTATVGGELTQSYIDRATQMFKQVQQDHSGSPWAARAQWELKRGFGVELMEIYHYYGPTPPAPPRPPGPALVPIPKL